MALTLPNDVARCSGRDESLCNTCSRKRQIEREKYGTRALIWGLPHIDPPIKEGRCHHWIDDVTD